jgi:hypothetical protein
MALLLLFTQYVHLKALLNLMKSIFSEKQQLFENFQFANSLNVPEMCSQKVLNIFNVFTRTAQKGYLSCSTANIKRTLGFPSKD